MLIYVFVEHYPNPYKPWIDTQLVELIRTGHDIRVLAEGAYTSTIHEDVIQHGLIDRTGYYPSTLRTLRRDGPRVLGALARRPLRSVEAATRVAGASSSPKVKVLDISRALVLPEEPPDICYIHNLVTASRLMLLKRLYPGTRVCLYFHGGEVGGQPRVRSEREIFDKVDAVVTGTRFAGDQAVDRGCAPAKIAVIPLGFRLSDYAPKHNRQYRPAGILRLVSVARMSPEKGFLYALQALQRVPAELRQRIRYTLIGTGIQYAELKSYAATHHLGDTVVFLGERTKQEVTGELEQSDALLLPSIVTDTWAETQAAVVQEALLMGCLTVTTAAGGVPESNAPIMHRFAVPPGDPDALAEKICELAAVDPSTWRQLAAAGRAFAADRYNIVALMELILSHALGKLSVDHPAQFASTNTTVGPATH